MTCYFRHLQPVFEEAGITITKENRKKVDETIHDILGVEYKSCPQAWKQLKIILDNDENRKDFILKLRDSINDP